ncbi:hypothetical protein L204_103438 [Cryptococcus depauperatus]
MTQGLRPNSGPASIPPMPSSLNLATSNTQSPASTGPDNRLIGTPFQDNNRPALSRPQWVTCNPPQLPKHTYPPNIEHQSGQDTPNPFATVTRPFTTGQYLENRLPQVPNSTSWPDIDASSRPTDLGVSNYRSQLSSHSSLPAMSITSSKYHDHLQDVTSIHNNQPTNDPERLKLADNHVGKIASLSVPSRSTIDSLQGFEKPHSSLSSDSSRIGTKAKPSAVTSSSGATQILSHENGSLIPPHTQTPHSGVGAGMMAPPSIPYLPFQQLPERNIWPGRKNHNEGQITEQDSFSRSFNTPSQSIIDDDRSSYDHAKLHAPKGQFSHVNGSLPPTHEAADPVNTSSQVGQRLAQQVNPKSHVKMPWVKQAPNHTSSYISPRFQVAQPIEASSDEYSSKRRKIDHCPGGNNMCVADQAGIQFALPSQFATFYQSPLPPQPPVSSRFSFSPQLSVSFQPPSFSQFSSSSQFQLAPQPPLPHPSLFSQSTLSSQFSLPAQVACSPNQPARATKPTMALAANLPPTTPNFSEARMYSNPAVRKFLEHLELSRFRMPAPVVENSPFSSDNLNNAAQPNSGSSGHDVNSGTNASSLYQPASLRESSKANLKNNAEHLFSPFSSHAQQIAQSFLPRQPNAPLSHQKTVEGAMPEKRISEVADTTKNLRRGFDNNHTVLPTKLGPTPNLSVTPSMFQIPERSAGQIFARSSTATHTPLYTRAPDQSQPTHSISSQREQYHFNRNPTDKHDAMPNNFMVHPPFKESLFRGVEFDPVKVQLAMTNALSWFSGYKEEPATYSQIAAETAEKSISGEKSPYLPQLHNAPPSLRTPLFLSRSSSVESSSSSNFNLSVQSPAQSDIENVDHQNPWQQNAREKSLSQDSEPVKDSLAFVDATRIGTVDAKTSRTETQLDSGFLPEIESSTVKQKRLAVEAGVTASCPAANITAEETVETSVIATESQRAQGAESASSGLVDQVSPSKGIQPGIAHLSDAISNLSSAEETEVSMELQSSLAPIVTSLPGASNNLVTVDQPSTIRSRFLSDVAAKDQVTIVGSVPNGMESETPHVSRIVSRDRIRVVIPISRTRRSKLILRGVYDPTKHDYIGNEESYITKIMPVPEEMKRYTTNLLGVTKNVSLTNSSMKTSSGETLRSGSSNPLRASRVVVSINGVLRTIRIHSPSPPPQRFSVKLSLPVTYTHILNDSLLDRCTARICRWDACRAILASENLLKAHVSRHLANEQTGIGRWKLQMKVNKFIFAGYKGQTSVVKPVPNRWLYKCIWHTCDDHCFMTKDELIQHLFGKHLSRLLGCPYSWCKYFTPSITTLARHVAKIHVDAADQPRPFTKELLPFSHKSPSDPLPTNVLPYNLQSPIIYPASYTSKERAAKVRKDIQELCIAPHNPMMTAWDMED